MAKITRKRVAALLLLILAAAFFFVLRGPYTSNFLKSLILPEAEKALGLRVIAKKMHLNPLPLYVEAVEVKAFNGEGEKAFTAESVKAYLGLSRIFHRELTIKTVVVKKPSVWLDRERSKRISDSLKATRRGGGKSLKLDLRNVVVRNGEVYYSDEKLQGLFEAKGLDAEVILRERPEVDISASELKASVEKWPEVKGKAGANFFVGKEGIEIRRMSAEVGGSTMRGSGNYFFDRTGTFRLDLNVLVDTVKKLRGLEKPGYGSIHARGTLALEGDIRNPRLDFDIGGDLYLQTLLEALKAKPGRELTGLLSLDGRIEGTPADLKGEAEGRLRNANLYTVDIDDVRSKIIYSDKVLSFMDGKAKLYGGRGTVNVSFLLPKAKPYTVDVEFWDVDSAPAFERLGLASFKLPAGKVKGSFHTSGMDFAPEGYASYEALESRDDPMGRFSRLSGKYRVKDKVVTLTEMEASSGATRLTFKGTYDTVNKIMDFSGDVFTADVRELTTPYFGRLAGAGEFHGTAAGLVEDPTVKGRFLIHNALFDAYPLGEVEMLASYRKNLLTVDEARAVRGSSEYRAMGKVVFPKARKLLELRDADFGLRLSAKGADLGGILALHKVNLPIEGRADGEVSIAGGLPTYSGSVRVSDGSLWGVPVSKADFGFSYDFSAFRVKDAVLRKGESVLALEGSITRAGVFDFRASSEKIFLRDAVPRELPFNYRMKLKAEGKGTSAKPEINISASLYDGSFMEWPVGSGRVEAALRGKDVSFDARVLDERAHAKGNVRLEGEFPWNADLRMERGRFDFLATAFLKEIPEDMMFGVTGRASASGTRSTLKADITLTQMTLAMYGQSFTNDDDIVLTVDSGLVRTPGFRLRSGTTLLNVEGSLKYKDYYDVVIYGDTSLAPLKAFSEKISLIRGNARFVLAFQGKWDKPKVNGGLDISDGAFGVVGIPQRLAEIKGFSYFEDGTLVVEKMDAKVGGGDVELSAVMRLDGLKPKTASVDMLLKDVNLTFTKGLKANVGGNLIFRLKPGSKLLTGEVTLNRAEYKDRIEWKSWLLKVRRAEAQAARQKTFGDVNLSVRLYGDRGIIIDNNVANAALKMDVVLRGTVNEPLLLGRVEATEGKVYFRNSEFNIVQASADFSDTSYAEPHVDIVAETTAKGFHIWLTLEGRPEQLDMTLVSDPDLDEEEILALLTVGEYGERLSGLEGGIGAAEASSVLTGGFQNIVAERLRDLTGLSRFTVEPYVSRKTGTITPKITVTKKLSGEKVFITYSQSVRAAEEQEIKLEYIVNKNISLVGGQDDLGLFGGDVKFKFNFK